ncbi:hypothetical protein H2200_005850 [Cladophialophora chaetospira]|uniref:Uncharacterized protein n=1 Tax=Cladophialophora chaetospira TaxID=386627 RepID=A0AA39CHZ9_9EURO|nr:hypothetical protein H2200_005850 [Cladophialophora chaetospira]
MADRAEAQIRKLEGTIEKPQYDDNEQNLSEGQENGLSEKEHQRIRDWIRKTTQKLRLVNHKPNDSLIMSLHQRLLYLKTLQTENDVSSNIGELGSCTPHPKIAQLEEEYEQRARKLEHADKVVSDWTRCVEYLEYLAKTKAGRQAIKELGVENLVDDIEKHQAERQVSMSLRRSLYEALGMIITERKRITSGQPATITGEKLANKGTSKLIEASTKDEEGAADDTATTTAKTCEVNYQDKLEAMSAVEAETSSEIPDITEDDWVVVYSSKDQD